jgi:hypothetical protein
VEFTIAIFFTYQVPVQIKSKIEAINGYNQKPTSVSVGDNRNGSMEESSKRAG